MQRFAPTVWITRSTQASLQSAATKITWEEVSDYSDKEKDAVATRLSKVKGQFNSVKEFPTLFAETIPTELPPLRKVNHPINPKPVSEWLRIQRPPAHKFG